MLVHLLEILLLISRVDTACTDYFTAYAGANSNSSMLIVTGDISFQCDAEMNDVVGAVGSCDLTCPGDSQLIAYQPSAVTESVAVSAQFDSLAWRVVPAAPATSYLLGPTTQFACSIRCGKYIDGAGTQFATRCNAVDTGAVCNEDRSLSYCTCSPGYTGNTCGVLIAMYDKIDQWLGPTETKKLLDIVNVAHSSPAALVSVLPSVYAMLSVEKKKAMSWTKDEMIASVGFEMEDVDVETTITQVFDEQLGNCYTFNYANETNSMKGLFSARFAGQSRDFTIDLKLHPEEQIAWIESAAVTTYIHAPGTPPNQGITYTVRAAESNLLALRKTITKLFYGCISSTKELKKNYYEDGDYTKEGCYFACYQDKVLEKCGCMDARLKKADSATQCLFKDKDCVDSVIQQYGDASSFPSCKCPSECYMEVYALSATRAALPFKIASCSNDTSGCPEVSGSIARLTIYIESLESEVYVEEEKVSLSSMLSNVGNELGFLLGMSIVGIIEILILCAQLGKEQFTFKKQ